MKKLLSVAAIAVLMVACKGKKDEKKPEETTTPTTTEQTTTPPATDNAGGVPKFSDAEVQKYVDDYTAYVTTLTEAYKTKDMSKVADLSKQATDWASRSTSVSQKLAANPDDAKKFTDYMTKLAQDLTAAAQAMTAPK